jgi:hypothetical protein
MHNSSIEKPKRPRGKHTFDLALQERKRETERVELPNLLIVSGWAQAVRFCGVCLETSNCSGQRNMPEREKTVTTGEDSHHEEREGKAKTGWEVDDKPETSATAISPSATPQKSWQSEIQTSWRAGDVSPRTVLVLEP